MGQPTRLVQLYPRYLGLVWFTREDAEEQISLEIWDQNLPVQSGSPIRTAMMRGFLGKWRLQRQHCQSVVNQSSGAFRDSYGWFRDQFPGPLQR